MIKNFEDLPISELEDFKILAIHEIDPDARFSILDGVMSWDESNKNAKPSEADIEKKALELQTLHKDLEYARNRQLDYPNIGDQIDMMYKDTKNSTTTHADAVEAVKTKWPKDNSGPV